MSNNYQYKYINTAMKEEIDELLAGEHGDALKAWSKECGHAAVEGCKDGLIKAGMLALGGVMAALKVVKKVRGVFEKRAQKHVSALMK